MEQNYSEKKPIRAALKEMEVGDIIHFPKERMSVVRSTTSTLGIEMERKYQTRMNRETMQVDVTRTE